jgi:hypothetical protein
VFTAHVQRAANPSTQIRERICWWGRLHSRRHGKRNPHNPAAASKCLTTISAPLAFPVRTLKPGVVGAPRQVFPAAGFLTNFSGSRIFDRRLSHALGVILAGL